MFHRFRNAVLGLTVAAAPVLAQTTGVPLINDYTINSQTSGSQSCTQLCIPTPATITMTVSTTPGAFVIIFWTDCPCRGCSVPWPANSCTPTIPNGNIPACLATNQSLDLFPAPGCSVQYQATLIANSAGIATQTVTAPQLSVLGTVPCASPINRMSTQAVVITPCGVGGFPVGPGPFVLTQAYDVGI